MAYGQAGTLELNGVGVPGMQRKRMCQVPAITSLTCSAGARCIGCSSGTYVARLASRGLEVLSLLAAGADTKEIAEQLGYSDRTIKSVIRDVQVSLGVKNRVQAVAEGIRQGLI